MMARRVRRIKPDMTPLIDCIFLLLVFFLVTSVFRQEESILSLILPQTQMMAEKAPNKGLYLELSNQEIAVNGKVITMDLLDDYVQPMQGQTIPVALRIDQKTHYERIARVMDILQAHQLYQIQFINELKSCPK